MDTIREIGSIRQWDRDQYLVVGVVALAVGSVVPPLGLAYPSLYANVPWPIPIFIVPGIFGLVAVAAGVQLYRLGAKGPGVVLAIVTLLTTFTVASLTFSEMLEL